MARNDVYLNINALSPADAVVTGQQDMTAATVPELVLGDTPTFNFYFTDNTNVWPSWAGNASYTLTWALSDAVAGDFAPAATTGNATPITGGWSVILPLNSYDLVGLLNTKRVGQPYPVQNLWQQLRVTDPSGNEVTRAMFWTPVRYRAISDTQNTESASPTGGRFVTVNNVNTLTTPTAAQFYAANPVPTSALGTAANGELLIGNGTGFTKATLTAGSGVSITNGSGSITITATDGDITLDDGTAAAPSLKFTADTDTGLFRPSDNVVGISAGGVSRATFGATSAINGTTIPGSKTLVVTTDKLSALAATTSAELAGVISDETGSGALVFANTPTLVTPNIGAATGTSVNLSGAGTFGGNLTVSGTGTSALTSSSSNLVVGSSTATSTNAVGVPQITAESDLYSSLGSIAHNNTNGNHGFLLVGKSRGTKASPTILADGDVFGELSFVAYDGAAYRTSGQIRSVIAGTPGASDLPTALDFRVAPDASATPATAMRIAPTGNVLLKSDGVDSGNGKLQLATHTTSAGGIGFGTSTSLYTDTARLVLVGGATTRFRLSSTSGNAADFQFDNSELAIGNSSSIRFYTTGGTALTLDSSANATFAGTVNVAKGAPQVKVSLDRNSSTDSAYLRYTTNGTQNWVVGTGVTGSDTNYGVYSYGGGGTALSLNYTTGAATFAGSLTTSAPTGGAGAWELGVYSAIAPTATGYVTIEIGGVQYKLLAST